MNDFSELEKDLKALRPARPSPVLFERIEEAMDDCRASAAADARGWRNWYRRFTETPYRIGIGLAAAAAAVLLLLARINTDQTLKKETEVAQIARKSEMTPGIPELSGRAKAKGSASLNKFVPDGAMQVVYNRRDEGLHFADGSREPLRRIRYQAQQTVQWRNPSTGASLRVSYPSEQVMLIPVSGQ
jgi:hypothetical protein